jgi:hypothetical protein
MQVTASKLVQVWVSCRNNSGQSDLSALPLSTSRRQGQEAA